jgi:hypothetical protein
MIVAAALLVLGVRALVIAPLADLRRRRNMKVEATAEFRNRAESYPRLPPEPVAHEVLSPQPATIGPLSSATEPPTVSSVREVHDAGKATSQESGQPTPAAAAVLQSSKPTTPAGNPSPGPATPDGFTGDSEDDDYAEFVAEVWRAPGTIKVEIVLQRVNYSGELVDSHLHSLLPRRDSGFYVNTIEAGLRKTYVSDRHKWRRDGLDVDSSAFRAIQSGVDPDVALRFAPYPASVEDALAPGNNHFRAEHRCFVIGYRNGRGDLAFRVVSGVRRGADQFTAHCHFHWGDRRTFLYLRLESVVDAESGEIIPVEKFADRSIPLSPHGYMGKLKPRP